MAVRYGNGPQKVIMFDSFVACCIRMRAFTDSFKSLDPRMQGRVENLTYDNFM
eukprot:Pgem_evm1s11615